jgi:hypothetical protein
MADSTTTKARARGGSSTTGSAVPAVTQIYTKKQHLAASLLADDELSDEQIANEVGITRKTLHNWKQNPEFAALIGDYTGQLQASVLRYAVAKKRKRVEALDLVFHSILEAIAHRTNAMQPDDSPMGHAARTFGDRVPPEASTGLFAPKTSVTPSGHIVTDYVFDAPMIRELRETMKQGAQEVGDWTEQSQIEHSGIVRSIVLEDD